MTIKLPEDMKLELQTVIAETMFDNISLKHMIWHGDSFKGLDHMSDHELIEEYDTYADFEETNELRDRLAAWKQKTAYQPPEAGGNKVTQIEEDTITDWSNYTVHELIKLCEERQEKEGRDHSNLLRILRGGHNGDDDGELIVFLQEHVMMYLRGMEV